MKTAATLLLLLLQLKPLAAAVVCFENASSGTECPMNGHQGGTMPGPDALAARFRPGSTVARMSRHRLLRFDGASPPSRFRGLAHAPVRARNQRMVCSRIPFGRSGRPTRSTS